MTSTAPSLDLRRALRFQPKQAKLWRLINESGPTAPTWIGYGGARGGGKSGGFRREALLLAIKQPGIMIWIIRRVFDDLKSDHIDKYLEEWPELADCHKIADKVFELPHGSRIKFVNMETAADVVRKSRGPEAKYIFVDQAEQFSEDELNRIHAANRLPGSEPGECKTVLGFNPGGIGTEFLRRVFHLKQYKDEEQATDYAFIQAYGWDNYQWFSGLGMSEDDFNALSSTERFEIFITQTDYGKKLNKLPPALKVGELMGSFEHFAGQYFAGVWDQQICTITAAQVDEIVQPWWTAWMAQDWGFGDHDCHLWFAAGKMSPTEWVKHFGGHTEWPIDVVIVYREYVINNRAEADLAMDIVERTPEHERRAISKFLLSSDAFGRKARQYGAHSVGEQFADIMRRHGLPTPEPADQSPGSRVIGWRFMYNCLRQSNMRGQDITQERAQEGPAVFISSECPNVLSCIPLAVRDEEDREDIARVAGVLWEDVTDAVRYGLKHLQEAKLQAPVGIRRQAAADAHKDNPTARAMAVRQFDAKERQRQVISRNQRFR